jgi:hypothetical protein
MHIAFTVKEEDFIESINHLKQLEVNILPGRIREKKINVLSLRIRMLKNLNFIPGISRIVYLIIKMRKLI